VSSAREEGDFRVELVWNPEFRRSRGSRHQDAEMSLV
jgi:hypothetical protein